MRIIDSMFSTTKRATISTIAIVVCLVLLGSTVTFASLYMDARQDAMERSAAQQAGANLPESQGATDKVAEVYTPDTVSGNASSAAGQQTAQAPQSSPAAPDNAQLISQEKAEDIALADAGIAREDADRIFSHLEMDDGYRQYEVQIYKDLFEYEYNISADTGAIFEKDADYIYD